MIENKAIEPAVSFSYLGSTVTQTGGTCDDVINRIKKANSIFVQLYPIWKNKYISRNTKLKIFHIRKFVNLTFQFPI